MVSAKRNLGLRLSRSVSSKDHCGASRGDEAEADEKVKMASLADKFSSVQEVDIDESGKFKYILIKVFAGSDSKFIVRGYDWAEFHGMDGIFITFSY